MGEPMFVLAKSFVHSSALKKVKIKKKIHTENHFKLKVQYIPFYSIITTCKMSVNSKVRHPINPSMHRPILKNNAQF